MLVADLIRCHRSRQRVGLGRGIQIGRVHCHRGVSLRCQHVLLLLVLLWTFNNRVRVIVAGRHGTLDEIGIRDPMRR